LFVDICLIFLLRSSNSGLPSLADTRYIKMFILDEADEMLSRGFKDQIYDVFRTLNETIQVLPASQWIIVDNNHLRFTSVNFGTFWLSCSK